MMMLLLPVLSALAAGAAAAYGSPSTSSSTSSDCKCLPSDDCWPTKAEWAKLNSTVCGRLIATVPLGQPCHGDAYDEATCEELQDEWLFSTVQ